MIAMVVQLECGIIPALLLFYLMYGTLAPRYKWRSLESLVHVDVELRNVMLDHHLIVR